MARLSEFLAGCKNPYLLGALFGFEVDFWSVFGHFWSILEVAWLSFYEFIELFNF
jgi:hypothetical protein